MTAADQMGAHLRACATCHPAGAALCPTGQDLLAQFAEEARSAPQLAQEPTRRSPPAAHEEATKTRALELLRADQRPSVRAVARGVGVDERTVRRWAGAEGIPTCAPPVRRDRRKKQGR